MAIVLDIQENNCATLLEEAAAFEGALQEADLALQQAPFSGFLQLPDLDPAALLRIEQAGARIAEQAEVLVVVGIGGSYLGARAGLDFCLGPAWAREKPGRPTVLFAGNDCSEESLRHILRQLEGRDFVLNMVSKSGGTLEPAIAFRVLERALFERYGEAEGKKRLIVTTDPENGPLRAYSTRRGLTCFDIPKTVGGRYSVLSAVGLLPMAACGIDIAAVLEGARAGRALWQSERLADNPCRHYAALRHALYRRGLLIELFCAYEERFFYFAEWLKQLFAESHGKEGRGIFPAYARFSTDLHSFGQYIQEGPRCLFETVLRTREQGSALKIPHREDDFDGLNKLAGRNIDEMKRIACEATVQAHVHGGVPNLILSFDRSDAYHFGALVLFFEWACALGGALLEVNPYDQPGVEQYKKNMAALF